MSHHIIEFDIRYECTITYVLFIKTVTIWVKTDRLPAELCKKLEICTDSIAILIRRWSLNKRSSKPKGQPRMDNPEAPLGTRHRLEKTKTKSATQEKLKRWAAWTPLEYLLVSGSCFLRDNLRVTHCHLRHIYLVNQFVTTTVVFLCSDDISTSVYVNAYSLLLHVMIIIIRFGEHIRPIYVFVSFNILWRKLDIRLKHT